MDFYRYRHPGPHAEIYVLLLLQITLQPAIIHLPRIIPYRKTDLPVNRYKGPYIENYELATAWV
jgi:hypothetical protein